MDNKRQVAFLGQARTLPQFNGMSDAEILQNVNDVLNSGNYSRIQKMSSAFSQSFPAYQGFSPDEVQSNLIDVFQPTGKAGQGVPQKTQSQLASNFATPYQNLAGKLFPASPLAKGAAAYLDAPMMIPNLISSGVQKLQQSNTAPDLTTQGLERLAGTAKVGLGVMGTGAAAIPMTLFGLGRTAVGQISPSTGEAVDKITNPVTSLVQPTSRGGQAASELADLGVQTLGFKALGKLSDIPALRNSIEERNLAKSELQFNRAVTPRGTDINRMDNLKRAEPYIKQAETQNPISQRDDGVSATRKTYEMLQGAAQGIYDKMGSQVANHAQETFDLSPVQNAVNSLVTPEMQRFDPASVAVLQKFAGRYQGDISLQEAFNEVKRLNAETKAYEKAAPDVQWQMRQTRPTLDAEIQVRDAMREEMLNKLEQLGEVDAGELRKDYGAVANLRNAVFSRINPAENQLNKPGGIIPSGMSDLGATILGEVAMKVAHGNPMGLWTGGAMGLLNRAVRESRRIDPTLESAIKGIGKSRLVPDPRDITPRFGANPGQWMPPQNPQSGGGGGGAIYPRNPGSPALGTPVSGALPNNSRGPIASLGQGQKALPELPTFRSTEDAIDYGRSNPTAADALATRRQQNIALADQLLKSGNHNEAIKVAVRAQLDREALEAIQNPNQPTPIERARGEAAKYVKTPAGDQGVLLTEQAKQPNRAISSNIPIEKQIAGTMFEPAKKTGDQISIGDATGLKGLDPNPLLKSQIEPGLREQLDKILRAGGHNLKVPGPDGKPLSSVSIKGAIDEWLKDGGREASWRAQALIQALMRAHKSGIVEMRPMKGMPFQQVPLEQVMNPSWDF